MKYILEAQKISKSFQHPKPVQVFKDVSLNVEQGSSIAIMGASGEGKTTLLHVLGTLEQIDSGTLSISNQPVATKSIALIRRFKVGFIFQTYNLLEDLTALDNVILPAQIARSNTEYLTRGRELLNLVGLDQRANFYAGQLSGGEKQRVAIARAFCNNPELILADEPSGNLDTENSKIIHDYLLTSVKKYHKTLVVVTHDKELAQLCDKTYLLKNQKLISI